MLLMLYTPSLDGSAVFGAAVTMAHEPCDVAIAYAAYFGVNGLFALNGGGRGRRWEVTGLLVAPDVPLLAVAVSAILSFQDGGVHTLGDTWGQTWPNVMFIGGWKPARRLVVVAGGGFALSYELELVGNQ
jgi:hypothetical protein